MDDATFSYQWMADDTNIQGATDPSYTLTEDDEGKAIKVQVSFTDDADNQESLPSAPTDAVAAAPAQNSLATGAPTITGMAQVGETLTADTSAINDEDGLNQVVFSYQWIRNDGNADEDIAGATGSSYTLTEDDEGKTVKVTVSFTDDSGNTESLPSDPTGEVAAKPNSDATGAPAISGTAQVGETLMANVTGIADEDGLENAEFTYQWIRNDGTEDADIPGATGSTHTPDENDVGKTLKVRMSFTDDADHGETLTSPPPAAVTAPPLTATLDSVPASHDGSTEFTFELHFSEEFTLSYTVLRDDAFTVTGGTVSKATRVDKGYNIKREIHVQPDGDGAVTIVLPVTTDCADDGAICTVDGRKLSTRLELTVSGPGGAPTTTDEPAPNTQATGQPTISGTAQVGETLTADVTGIADEDGLDNVTFSYQWMADEAEIQGATGSGYTLAAEEEGKAITVTVSFTDAEGNPETLTSDPTGEVVAKPNIQATGLPTISGTVQVGETLTADTSGIDDEDGLTNPGFTYQWMADDTNIQDATGSSYTLTEDDEDKTITVTVSFTDAEGNPETLTSDPTGEVAAKPNIQATGLPTISGTAQVGETLMAGISGIADEDGLDNVTFSYQWMADDTNIQDATGSSYTLTEDDEGKTITVKVSFTDAEGNPETLTSDPTGEVTTAPAQNIQATGLPTAVDLVAGSVRAGRPVQPHVGRVSSQAQPQVARRAGLAGLGNPHPVRVGRPAFVAVLVAPNRVAAPYPRLDILVRPGARRGPQVGHLPCRLYGARQTRCDVDEVSIDVHLGPGEQPVCGLLSRRRPGEDDGVAGPAGALQGGLQRAALLIVRRPLLAHEQHLVHDHYKCRWGGGRRARRIFERRHARPAQRQNPVRVERLRLQAAFGVARLLRLGVAHDDRRQRGRSPVLGPQDHVAQRRVALGRRPLQRHGVMGHVRQLQRLHVGHAVSLVERRAGTGGAAHRTIRRALVRSALPVAVRLRRRRGFRCRRRCRRRWRVRLLRGSRRGVGPGELGPFADTVLVHGLDPVHAALLRLHAVVGVARRRRAGVGVDGYELAGVVDVAVPPQHLVMGDAGVVGVVPGQVNAVVGRLGGQSRGLIRYGAVLGLNRCAGEGQEQGGKGDEQDSESGSSGESHGLIPS